MRQYAKRRLGFTLVELIVVVAMVGLLSAIVLPALLKAAEKARARRNKARQAVTAEASSEDLEEGLAQRPQLPQGILPDIESAKISIQLSSSHHRIGMEVHTRFEAAYKGDLVISNPTEDKAPVRLTVPLPDGTTEARDVFLYLGSGADRKEARNVVYDRNGIHWAGTLPPGEPQHAHVTFVASGRERFVLRLPPARRIRDMNVGMTLDTVSPGMIPDDALQPTAAEAKTLTWKYRNLVTDRGIVIDIPGKRSPLGRALLLFRLVGIAVMLFGFGFWYLSDPYRPALLETFRWGHFFLLALTYSLFFVIFAVLAFRGDVGIWTAMAIAAVLAVPLLVLHVSRVTDLTFATTRTIPLAAFTLAMVINGVYGAGLRDYIFIAGIFVAVAFFTVTYKKWAASREEADALRENKVGEAVEKLRAQASAAQAANSAAGNVLKGYPGDRDRDLQGLLREKRKLLAHMLREQSEIAKEFGAMLAMPKGFERSSECRSIRRKSQPLGEVFATSIVELQETTQELETRKRDYAAEQKEKREKEPVGVPDESRAHCMACGKGSAQTPYCPHCGTPRPRELACKHCGAVFLMPVHLLRRKADGEPTHCLSCGKAHRKATGEK